MVKKLNESSSAVIEENFLKENPDQEYLDPNEKVVLSTHIPKMIKGIFVNLDDAGCAMSFPYKTKTHPLKSYTLFHGYEHELPEEVVNFLEGNWHLEDWTCHSRQHKKYEMRPDGIKQPTDIEYKPRFQFKRSRARA